MQATSAIPPRGDIRTGRKLCIQQTKNKHKSCHHIQKQSPTLNTQAPRNQSKHKPYKPHPQKKKKKKKSEIRNQTQAVVACIYKVEKEKRKEKKSNISTDRHQYSPAPTRSGCKECQSIHRYPTPIRTHDNKTLAQLAAFSLFRVSKVEGSLSPHLCLLLKMLAS